MTGTSIDPAPGLGQEVLSDFGERKGARGPLHQGHPQKILQLAQAQRHRRLRHVQGTSRALKAAVIGNRDKRLYTGEIEETGKIVR